MTLNDKKAVISFLSGNPDIVDKAEEAQVDSLKNAATTPAFDADRVPKEAKGQDATEYISSLFEASKSLTKHMKDIRGACKHQAER